VKRRSCAALASPMRRAMSRIADMAAGEPGMEPLAPRASDLHMLIAASTCALSRRPSGAAPF